MPTKNRRCTLVHKTVSHKCKDLIGTVADDQLVTANPEFFSYPGAQATGTATSAEDGDPGENSAAPPKEHRPFILDGLL